MRRGELLKLPELKVTETMRKTVREDQGHQVLRRGRPPVWSATYYWFYRAKKTGTVLEIDVFTRDMILDGTAHPKYRVFLLEENKYYTYDNLCEKWRTAKIDNLSYWEGRGEIEEGYWYSSGKYGYEKGTENGSQNFVTTGRKSHVQQSQDGKAIVKTEKRLMKLILRWQWCRNCRKILMILWTGKCFPSICFMMPEER